MTYLKLSSIWCFCCVFIYYMHRWLENKFSASHLSWCPQHLLVQEQGDGSIRVLISLAVLGRKLTQPCPSVGRRWGSVSNSCIIAVRSPTKARCQGNCQQASGFFSCQFSGSWWMSVMWPECMVWHLVPDFRISVASGGRQWVSRLTLLGVVWRRALHLDRKVPDLAAIQVLLRSHKRYPLWV